VRLASPEPLCTADKIDGKIVYVDGFGNLFTNIRERDLQGLPKDSFVISLGKHKVEGLTSNYAAGSGKKLLAVINSWGLLEIALYKGSAQRYTDAKLGDSVYLRLVP
jgi:S-adenosylmethionine hydrolase